MGMSYDPKAKSTGGVPPGEYPFKIIHSVEEKYGTGNRGLTLRLEIYAPSRSFEVTERIVYVPKALFKMEQLAKCIGFDYDNPPDPSKLVGATGSTVLRKDENNKWLEVESFTENPSARLDTKRATPVAQVAEEEVPF
jgi:hypothetical protein